MTTDSSRAATGAMEAEMVSIVITHGRSQEFGIGETIEEDWTRALRQGLGDAGASFARSIPVDFAFYGTLWRPDADQYREGDTERERGGGADDAGDDATPTDTQVALAQEMLSAASVERGETERLGWDTMAKLVGTLDKTFGVGKVALKYFLNDIDAYFSNTDLRERAISKVVDTIRANDPPGVLLAHSLGTIVAYDALRQHPDLPVPGLVTFGSPLGLATVRARLKETGGDLIFPSSVRRWVNIYEERDFVAAGIELAPLYVADDGRTVEDRLSIGRGPGLGNLVASHDAIVYLSSAALATATRDIVESLMPQAAPPTANGHDAEPPERHATRGIPPDAIERQEAAPTTPARRSIPATGAGQERREIPAVGGEVERGGGPGAMPPSFGATATPPEAADTDGETKREISRSAAASFPPLVAPGAIETLSFQIGAAGMVSGDVVGTDAVKISVPESMTSLDLAVAVQAPDFDVVDNRGNLASSAVGVTLDLTNDSALIEGAFKLRAHEVDQRTSADVRLRILRDNNPVATLTLPTIIAKGAAGAPDRPAQLSGSIMLRENATPGAELTLYVNDRDGDDRFEIAAVFKGDARVQPMYYLGNFPVQKDAWEYSRDVLEKFRQARDQPDRVDALGISLWNNLPKDFQAFYWEHVHGKVTTILICSDEPYIPWELIKPQRSPGGETAPMLGLAYQMGRWEDQRNLPGDDLVVSDFVVIAPAYAAQPLPSADVEAKELISEFHARREQPGNLEQVKSLFKDKSPQILHFSGHGQFGELADNSQIALADATLDTIDVATATFGKDANPPLIFLNACEVGAQGWSLTKIGGWAEAFCQAGATGFIGPYWPVADGVARKAALVFYRSLQAGQTVGEAMKRVRERYTEDDEYKHHPSWLAYSLHCHPNVRVQLATPAGV